MSKYVVCKQKFLDKDTLIESMIECGIPQAKISLYDKPIAIEGYHGKEEGLTGTIVIHKGAVGNRYDIGFTETAEGFVPQICDMDLHVGAAKTIMNGDLVQTYGKTKVIKEVQKKYGWRIKGQKKLENGRIQIKIGVK